MPHWKLTLAYDGTPFNGWQIQPNLPTVQGALAQAIQRITGENVLPQGSGRTDTGVHALAQVATFSLAAPIPAENLHRALNRALPASIRVLSAETVAEDFHARYNARRKTYEYRILPGDRICSPMLAPYVWSCRFALDLNCLQQAATHILGTHDFTSFAANDPDLTTREAEAASALKDHNQAPSHTAQPCQETVISTEGGALAAAVEKPASLPQPVLRPDLTTHNATEATANKDSWTDTPPPRQRTVISTEGGALAAAVEKPASLPQPVPRPDLTTHNATEAKANKGSWTDTAPPRQRTVISTEGGAIAAAVEKPASLPQPIDNTRTIYHSAWHQQDDLLIYRVTGSGFLHHMVRNLVGTFVEAGSYRISADSIPDILAARSRSAAGPTAPASGLFLVEVEY
jgi:tRNA pseudouridine(38-40) synthase